MDSGGQPNMQQLFQQAQQMQQQMMEAQEELGRAQVQGTAGGGLVTATVTGMGELTSLSIDPKAVDPSDTETLADLVVAAVRDASGAAGQLQTRTLGPLAQGLGDDAGGAGGAGGGLGLPGL